MLKFHQQLESKLKTILSRYVFFTFIFFHAPYSNAQNITNITTTPSCAFSPTGSIQLSIDANLLEPSYILPFETQILNTSTGEIIIEIISSWNTTFEQLAAGLYELTIDLTDECDLLLWNIEITEIPTTDINAIAKVILAPCGVGVGSIHILSTSNGTPPYSYLWNTGATSAQLLDIPPGTYCVTITDAECGYRELCRTVGQAIPRIDVVNFKHIGQCENGSALLNCDGFVDIEVSGMTGGTPSYLWSGPNGFSSSQQDINGLCTAGTYNVTVTFSDQCAPLIQQINLCCCSDFNVNGQPSQQCQLQNLPLSVTSTVIPSTSGLNNGMIFLELTGGSGDYLCTWTRDNAPYKIGPSRIFNLSPGLYCVSINDGCSLESYYACFTIRELSCDHVYTNDELIEIFVSDIVPECTGSGNGSIVLNTPHSTLFTPSIVSGTINSSPIVFTPTGYYMEAYVGYLNATLLYQITITLGTCTFQFEYQSPESAPTRSLAYADFESITCVYHEYCNSEFVATVEEMGYLDFGNGTSNWFTGKCTAPMYCGGHIVGEVQLAPVQTTGLGYWALLQTYGASLPHIGVLLDWFNYHEVHYCDKLWYCPGDFAIMHIQQGFREILSDWSHNYLIFGEDGCVRANCPWPIADVEVCIDDLPLPDIIEDQFLPDLTGCGPVVSFSFMQIVAWEDEGTLNLEYPNYNGSSLQTFVSSNRHRTEARCASVTFCKNSFVFLFSNIESVQCGLLFEIYDPCSNPIELTTVRTCDEFGFCFGRIKRYACCAPGHFPCLLTTVTADPDLRVLSTGGAFTRPGSDNIPAFFNHVYGISLSHLEEGSFYISPNPFANEFSIRTRYPYPFHAQIYDWIGVQLQTHTFIQYDNAIIDMAHNPPGVYLLRISSIDGETLQSLKMIKL